MFLKIFKTVNEHEPACLITQDIAYWYQGLDTKYLLLQKVFEVKRS